MLRWAIAGAIVVGLLVGIWLVWPREEEDPGSTTLPVAVESTTTESTTTTTQTTTTTTADPTQVRDVETVEQAEAILRELWFGWFEGIYNQDEERIREVVATEEQVETAREAFGMLPFRDRPEPKSLNFSETEILRSDHGCIAVWSRVDATEITGASTDGLHVLRSRDGTWVLYSVWGNRRDLWEDDCDAQFAPLA